MNAISICNIMYAGKRFVVKSEMEITYWLITAMDSTLPPLICSYPAKYIFSSRSIVCIYGTMKLYSDRVIIEGLAVDNAAKRHQGRWRNFYRISQLSSWSQFYEPRARDWWQSQSTHVSVAYGGQTYDTACTIPCAGLR